MMLILVVIASLINRNVIAGPASVSTENGSSLITVLNTCSQDPPCFVSFIISFQDVKLYRSPILGSADKNYFPYANTTIGLHVTLFKHIDVHDPGTVITTKKLGDDENPCFVVSGNYWTPKISMWSNDDNLAAKNSSQILKIMNESSPSFVLNVDLRHGNQTKKQKKISSSQTANFTFEAGTTEDGVVNFSIYKLKEETSVTSEPIWQSVQLLEAFDVCMKVTGNYSKPLISYVVCYTPWANKTSVNTRTFTANMNSP